MRLIQHPSGQAITLGPADFVAEGGEGKVYARAGVAYKVYHAPGLAPPQAKLDLLAAVASPQIVAPMEALVDAQGQRVGHTMRHVPDAHPLCRLFTSSFRQRHSLHDHHALHLIGRLRDLLARVHAAGLLVVDLNEMNVLVGPRFDEVFLIDVESWQAPGHPATAILDPVRDRHATHFGEASDWFAFAVLAFQLLVGVHPYKGKHPTVKGLDARMRADLSVFSPAVRVPPAARPLDRIPPALRAWFEQVFDHRLRTPPPVHGGAPAPAPPALPLGQALQITPVWTAPAAIWAVTQHLGVRCAVTADGVFVDGRRVGPAPPGAVAIGFTAREHTPVLARAVDGALHLSTADGTPIPCALAARAVTAVDGRLIAHGVDTLVALDVRALGGRLMLVPRVLARVRPHATTLFDGVAIQRAPGSALATVFPASGQALTLRLPRLADARVIDARADGGVLVVVARRGDRLDRHEIRFDASGRFDHQQIADASPTVGLITLDAGVAVIRTDGDTLDLRPSQRDAPGRRQICDPALAGELTLIRLGDAVGAIHGNRLLRLSLTAG